MRNDQFITHKGRTEQKNKSDVTAVQHTIIHAQCCINILKSNAQISETFVDVIYETRFTIQDDDKFRIPKKAHQSNIIKYHGEN